MAVLVSLVSVNAKLSSDSETLALTGTKEARTAIADEDRAVLSILYCKENMLKIDANPLKPIPVEVRGVFLFLFTKVILQIHARF